MPGPLYGSTSSRRVTIHDLAQAKLSGDRWPMITSYDALTAGLFDAAGFPVLLVGDSYGMVVLGHENTLALTVDELIPAVAAVARSSHRAMVVAYKMAPATTMPNDTMRWDDTNQGLSLV